ncbi:hypothetical protein Micbo1qcDRAFT_181259 [Microdochium bolleyi]|uniref:Uncharacterized protein n=1 Tax=Microdochium bolleyi TaxID=196109 RepID=A0A136IIV8_9PEZI|nr:hypothetical protein Micbo1qcDRAFT_181259 [Microdochium bolleyi]
MPDIASAYEVVWDGKLGRECSKISEWRIIGPISWMASERLREVAPERIREFRERQLSNTLSNPLSNQVLEILSESAIQAGNASTDQTLEIAALDQEPLIFGHHYQKGDNVSDVYLAVLCQNPFRVVWLREEAAAKNGCKLNDYWDSQGSRTKALFAAEPGYFFFCRPSAQGPLEFKCTDGNAREMTGGGWRTQESMRGYNNDAFLVCENHLSHQVLRSKFAKCAVLGIDGKYQIFEDFPWPPGFKDDKA